MDKKPRDNRIPIMMSDQELSSIDDWRFANRVATRADAVRRLVQVGLAFDGALPEVEENLEGLALSADAVLKTYDAWETDRTEIDGDVLWVNLVEVMTRALQTFRAVADVGEKREAWLASEDFERTAEIVNRLQQRIRERKELIK